MHTGRTAVTMQSDKVVWGSAETADATSGAILRKKPKDLSGQPDTLVLRDAR